MFKRAIECDTDCPIVFNLNDKYSHWAETDDELGVYYMSTSKRRTEEKKISLRKELRRKVNLEGLLVELVQEP